MRTQARKDDADNITLTRAEFIDIARAGAGNKNNIRDWLRLSIAITIPLLAAFMYFSQTAFQVEQNKLDIVKQEIWVENHKGSTDEIKKAIGEIALDQAIVLEKITALEKNMPSN